MGYTIPQNWNDEAMEYVNKLTDKINVGWDGEDYCLSDWNLRFLSRMNREVIKPPFTYQAFLDNKDIIATLEGYELDVKKILVRPALYLRYYNGFWNKCSRRQQDGL